MKLIKQASTLFSVILTMACSVPVAPAATMRSADLDVLTKGNTSFACHLYARLKETQGNLFFSPYSIATALAMTYAGARGNTAKEMSDTLHFTLEAKRLHAAWAHLQEEMRTVKKKGQIELNIANSLWSQQGYGFEEMFFKLVKENYQAEVTSVDFQTAYEAVRKEINAYVERATRSRIKDLIKPGVLDRLTRLVLANAIYFKGDWANPFKKSDTQDLSFQVTPDRRVDVPMMYQLEKFNYMENDILQLLELPYADNDLSMLVFLPRKIDGLTDLENLISVSNLEKWTAQSGKREVRVYLPRFSTRSQFSLTETLQTMGMTDAFHAGRADFSGIDGTRNLFISAVVHEAFVDVNEKGTEAAAATGVVVVVTAMPPPPAVFRADHPFLFLIRDNRSGSILFMGRVTDPSDAG